MTTPARQPDAVRRGRHPAGGHAPGTPCLLACRAQFAALAGLLVAAGWRCSCITCRPGLRRRRFAYGAAFGLFPIGWIILNAMFIYNPSVRTGQFEVLQRQVAGVSRDRRIQALLIAFGFGRVHRGRGGV